MAKGSDTPDIFFVETCRKNGVTLSSLVATVRDGDLYTGREKAEEIGTKAALVSGGVVRVWQLVSVITPEVRIDRRRQTAKA